MTEPIEITVNDLYAKIGQLVVENEILHSQLAAKDADKAEDAK